MIREVCTTFVLRFTQVIGSLYKTSLPKTDLEKKSRNRYKYDTPDEKSHGLLVHNENHIRLKTRPFFSDDFRSPKSFPTLISSKFVTKKGFQ